MKHITTLFCLLLITLTGFAQKRTCLSELDMRAMRTQDPARYQRHIELENFTARFMQGNEAERLSDPNGLIVIPVVVHVLHQGEAVGTGRNISVAQIQSQIDVLNEDFRRTNADRNNTPAAFTGVAADLNIEFRLACQDPNGNATNGILRRQTSRASYTVVQNSNGTINETSTGIKFTANGGQDAWPTNRYLNMWVCTLNGGILGYATFPADFAANPNVDGVVINTTSMGRTGNVVAPFNGGRTATHEVGHWLNLRHIWGDANCGDDLVGDTPTQQGPSPNLGCPVFPRRTCGNTTNGDMFMNYMDYTDDACMNMYTIGQRTRGRAVFAAGGPRAAFIDNYFRLNNPAQNPICGTSTTITVNNPTCLPVAWSVTGPATITGSGNSATITRNGNGTVNVTATAGGYTDTKTISAGTPGNASLQVNETAFDFCNTGLMQFNATLDNPTGATIRWSVVGTGASIKFGAGTLAPVLQIRTTGSFEIRGEFTNACGVSTYSSGVLNSATFWTNYCGFFRFTVSPNPVKDNMTVLFEKPLAAGKTASAKLYEFGSNRMVRQWTLSALQYKDLNVADLKKGQYILEVTIDKQRSSRQIVLE